MSPELDTRSVAWERAGELLAKLSIEEKAQQVSCVMPIGILNTEGNLSESFRAALKGGIGHVAALGTFGFKSPVHVARAANTVQRYLVEETPHSIPAIIHNEALSGVVAPEYTAFPTSIGLAATWDPAGVEAMTELIKRQMRSVGLLQALSPVMDLGRDARWGRVHETYGEDPYLVSTFSVAFVRGLQGSDLRDGVIATGKHFLGYSFSQAGQNMAAVQLGSRELYEDWGRPFEAAIHEAGLASIMNSYSTVNGVPVGASPAILTDFLRGVLGFDGTVVSDYSTVEMLHNRLEVAASPQQAGILALSAGLDVELASIYGYGAHLAEAVHAGAVSEELLNESARRVLRDKFALGLFDNPYVNDDPIVINDLAHEGSELSLDLARKSVTLLKNEGGVLPLSRDTQRIAVLGPYADLAGANYAAYTYPAAAQMLRTIAGGQESSMAGVDASALDNLLSADSIESVTAEIMPLLTLDQESYIRESYETPTVASAIRTLLPNANVTVVPTATLGDEGDVECEAAVAAARDADIAVLAIGGRAGWFSPGITEGEGADTADIDLPVAQQKLVRAVAATGTPVVAVFFLGRPYALTPVIDDIQGIVTNYYGGTHGSEAAVDALFGVINPGGRLPVTIPRNSGQVPIYAAHHRGSSYNRTADDLHKAYLDLPSTPLYAFGHGLSYTSFEYGPLTLAASSIDTRGEIVASVTVSNTGARSGDEVVQLYARDTATGVTRPIRALVGFHRVSLEPGESTQITFTVPLSTLGYEGLSGDFIIEPGDIRLLVGASSEDIRSEATVQVTGAVENLTGKRTFFSSVTTAPA